MDSTVQAVERAMEERYEVFVTFAFLEYGTGISGSPGGEFFDKAQKNRVVQTFASTRVKKKGTGNLQTLEKQARRLLDNVARIDKSAVMLHHFLVSVWEAP